jgi:hypothetical protein
MFRHRPGEEAVGQLPVCRLAPGDKLQHFGCQHAMVAVLDQHPAGDDRHRLALPRRVRQGARQEKPQILFPREDRPGALAGFGRDDDFSEDLPDRQSGLLVERPVDRDDPAEGRHVVACQRFAPGIDQPVGARHTAGIRVLDDDHGRRPVAKFGDQLQRGAGIVEIIIAELLALHLAGLRDPAGCGTGRTVKRGPLVRIFAVAKRHDELRRHRTRRREQLLLVHTREPG